MGEAEPLGSFLEGYGRICGEFAELLASEVPSSPQGPERLASGLPWVDSRALHPPSEHVRRLLQALLQELQTSAASNRAVLKRLDDAVRTGAFVPEEFLRAILHRDGPTTDLLAERLGAPTQVLHFLGTYLARPFLAAAARDFHPQRMSAERATASCPGCGQEPALALLLPDDGQRRLWCRYCGVEWPVRRVLCVSCGNTDSGTLGYFRIEGLTATRVDYCETCRRYIKTVDLRASGQMSDALARDREDLLSGELDLAAVREGFLPLGESGPSGEWRRTGMGGDRKKGGPP